MGLRVLLMGVNFAPELTAIGPLTAQLAQHLASRGNQVQVSTAFPHYPEWRFHPGYRRGLYRRERIGAVTVRRSRHVVPKRPNSITGRTAYDLSIAAGASVTGLMAGRIDVVVAVTSTLATAAAASVLARARGVPLVLWLQDLVSDIALAVGMLSSDSLVYRAASGIESYLHDQAQLIVVISDAFKEKLIARGVPAHKVVVQPNWIDTETVRPLDGSLRFRARCGFAPIERLVLHAGTMGLKQGLDTAVSAAAQLRDEPDTRLVFVGEGPVRASLEARVRTLGLTNVSFLPFQPVSEPPDMLSSADLLLINQRGSIVELLLPSKLLAYMAAGRPIVAAVHQDSATARVLTSSGSGVLVAPDDPCALAEGIRGALGDRAGLAEMGRRGRRYVEAHCSAEVALPRLSELIEGAMQARRRR